MKPQICKLFCTKILYLCNVVLGTKKDHFTWNSFPSYNLTVFLLMPTGPSCSLNHMLNFKFGQYEKKN